MPETNAEARPLTFQHTRLLIALGALALLSIAALAYWNSVRHSARVEAWRQKICGPLPGELVLALNTLHADSSESPRQVRAIFPMLKELSGEDSDELHARIIFRTQAGFREVAEWSSELSRPRDHDAIVVTTSDCAVTHGDSQTRIVRTWRSAGGTEVRLVLEDISQ